MYPTSVYRILVLLSWWLAFHTLLPWSCRKEKKLVKNIKEFMVMSRVRIPHTTDHHSYERISHICIYTYSNEIWWWKILQKINVSSPQKVIVPIYIRTLYIYFLCCVCMCVCVYTFRGFCFVTETTFWGWHFSSWRALEEIWEIFSFLASHWEI